MKPIFSDDGRLIMVAGCREWMFSTDDTNYVISACVQEYAKRKVVERLNLIDDDDADLENFYGMHAEDILSDDTLLDAIASGCVGSWDLDLQETEIMDREIQFWTKERSIQE